MTPQAVGSGAWAIQPSATYGTLEMRDAELHQDAIAIIGLLVVLLMLQVIRLIQGQR